MWDWVDIFSIAWAVPLVLDAMMSIAGAVYDFFVSGGIIYMLVWGWLAFSIGLYLIKMYFPEKWVEFFGLSGGGQMYKVETDGWSVTKDVAKPMLRALFAVAVLLQVKPTFITNFVINPFLEFGAVYVSSITNTILPDQKSVIAECPKDLGEYLSNDSCQFLVRPIHEISMVNNDVIKKGFQFLGRGLVSPSVINIFLNIITGLLLIVTFFASNVFMSMLLIQGIFKFGMELIKYPFMVLVYVVKNPDKDDDYMWVNPWPAFKGIIKSLQKLIIAMIAVAFILLINISLARAMFGFDADSVQGFGGHSITWLAAFLNLWIMGEIFSMTRKKLEDYVGDKDMTGFADAVIKDGKGLFKSASKFGSSAIKIIHKGKDAKLDNATKNPEAKK